MNSTVKIILGIILILLVWILSWYLIDTQIPIDKRGSFGDKFGAINSLFSGLALFGIIASLIIQRNEFKLQREELKNTREEFKINRITSILFKQTDYLNKSIESVNFYSSSNYSFYERNLNIDEFLVAIDEVLIEGQGENGVKLLIEENDKKIKSITDKIISILDLINDIILVNELNNTEELQIKNVFIKNLHPNLFPLIQHHVTVLKNKLEKGETDDLERKLFKTELNKYLRILEFGMVKNTTHNTASSQITGLAEKV